jgi:hypothetical protein
MVVALPRLNRHQDRDRLVFALMMALAGFQILVGWTRPAGFIEFMVKDICMVIAFFCLVPVPLPYQLPCSSLLLVGDCVNIALRRGNGDLNGLAPVALGGAFLMFALGFYTSLQLNRQKRLLYLAGVVQGNLTRELESALAEIRTLSGIVPICCHCKMIRDEGGAWHPVEVYVKRNSHAEFSHGICPTCMETHYAEAEVQS